jgi:hypothetical protein
VDIQPKLDELAAIDTPEDAYSRAPEAVTRSVAVVGLLGIAMVHLLDLPGTIEDAPTLAVAFTGLIVAT